MASNVEQIEKISMNYLHWENFAIFKNWQISTM